LIGVRCDQERTAEHEAKTVRQNGEKKTLIAGISKRSGKSNQAKIGGTLKKPSILGLKRSNKMTSIAREGSQQTEEGVRKKNRSPAFQKKEQGTQ